MLEIEAFRISEVGEDTCVMKKSKLSFLLGIIALAFIGLTECTKDNPAPTMPESANNSSTTNSASTTSGSVYSNGSTTIPMNASSTTSGSGSGSTNSTPPDIIYTRESK